MSKLNFKVRARMEEDTDFLFSSWLKSNRESPLCQAIPAERYFYAHHRIIESYLDDSTTVWAIAHDPDNPRFIYGYLCFQVMQRANESISPVLHYSYVKFPFRRLGVASELLRLAGVNRHVAAITTHKTLKGDQLLSALEITQELNPYLAWARAPVIDQVPAPMPQRERRLHDKAIRASRKALAFDPGAETEQ